MKYALRLVTDGVDGLHLEDEPPMSGSDKRPAILPAGVWEAPSPRGRRRIIAVDIQGELVASYEDSDDGFDEEMVDRMRERLARWEAKHHGGAS